MSSGQASLALGGLGLFVGSRELAARDRVSPGEERLFRLANAAPESIRVPVRAVMQAGTFGTVPAIAALALLTARRRLATEVALGGTAAWLLAKAAKPMAGRPRPAELLEDVNIRESIAGDLGWVSGHTAVATTLALTLSRSTPPRVRPVLGAVVAVTGFGRMYVGAHLPLDLVGGAGLGMVLGAAMRWLDQVDGRFVRRFGTKTPRPRRRPGRRHEGEGEER